MTQPTGMTVAALMAAMRGRSAKIPAEIGAFIVLEASEASVARPVWLSADAVFVGGDGRVSLLAGEQGTAGQRDSAEGVARSLLEILASLLVAAQTAAPRGLLTLLESGPSSGVWDVRSVCDDLEASLVPLNREAARRVLARFVREMSREERGPRGPAVDDEALDQELDSLLGAGDSMPPAPTAAPAGAASMNAGTSADHRDRLDAELDAALQELDGTLPVAPVPEADRTLLDHPEADAAPRPPSLRPVARVRGLGDGVGLPVGGRAVLPNQARADQADAHQVLRAEATDAALHLSDDAVRPRTGLLVWAVAFFALIAATVAGAAVLRPDLVDQLLGRPGAPSEPEASTAERQAALNRAHRSRYGRLAVEATPERTQVLIHVGEGPAMAEQLPTGMAHEFVAIADGRAPARAVLPPGVAWPEVDGVPRYELAIQTPDQAMSPEDLALGPTRLPQNVGRPGPLGNVRIVTNPPGAKVYVVVGFSPGVTVENVRADRPVEVLLYREGHRLERRRIEPGDWEADADGGKHHRLEVELLPDAPRRRRRRRRR